MSQIVTEPVYKQLSRVCREDVAGGRFGPGEKFPSERELAERFGVSRATANKVISNMVAENLLEFRPGIGTFVRSPKTLQASLRQIESFTQYALAQGMRPETQVLIFERVSATEAPAIALRALGMGNGGRGNGSSEASGADLSVGYVRRLRLADGEPIILEERWLAPGICDRCAAMDFEESFYDLLQRTDGITPVAERNRIVAQILSDEAAALLDCPAGSPSLVVEGTGFAEMPGAAPKSTTARRPIWFQRLYHRADRFELANEVEVGSAGSTTLNVTESLNKNSPQDLHS